MSAESIEQFSKELSVVYKPNTIDGLFPVLVDHVGDIRSTERVSGGYVHYVFKIVGENMTSYLKARSDHFARLPHIATDPSKIEDEYKALSIYLDHCANYFPQILHFDPELHYLLLSELMPGVSTLEHRFLHEDVSQNEIYTLGYGLGDIHAHTENVGTHIRKPDDNGFRDNLFKFVIEYFNHSSLLETSKEHKNRPTNLLIGDSSPKNVFVNGVDVSFCDLEGSHQGSLVYDQAFMLAHILLHQKTKRQTLEAVESFSSGYAISGRKIDFNDKLLTQTIQAIFLYRLDNPVIPYNLSMSQLERKNTANRIYSTLNMPYTDIETLVHNLRPN